MSATVSKLTIVVGPGERQQLMGLASPATIPPDTSDDALLDAYSRAVIGAVDRVGPAVLSLNVGHRRAEKGAGSGVLIAPDGYVLTNAHVVDGASSIEVTLTTGDSMNARTVGVDRATDLAIVRIAGAGLPFVAPRGPVALKLIPYACAMIAVFTPTSRPSVSTSGPPEFPGLSGAVCSGCPAGPSR